MTTKNLEVLREWYRETGREVYLYCTMPIIDIKAILLQQMHTGDRVAEQVKS